MRITNNGYLVEGSKDFIEGLNGIINWFNFSLGEIYFDDNCNEYEVIEVSHDTKYIKLV